MSKTSILKIPVNFPSPNEQAAIANVLNKADCLVDESKKKIMELRQLKRLLLGKAFSLEWRFRGFNDPWEQRKLKDLSTDIGTGKSIFSKLSKSNINDYKVLGSTSIIGYSDDFDYEGNFILTARVGANAGNIYRESGKVKISDNTVFIKAIQSDFLYYVLMNFNLKRLSFGTGQPLIKSSELKNLKLQVSVSDSERKKLGLLFVTTDNLIVANERQEKIALIRSVQFSPTSLINFEYFR
ncbi:hsdS3 protein [Levilactobacillus parabrevis]|nr:hsdS3 protein [Levilactobacillus parabrevis]